MRKLKAHFGTTDAGRPTDGYRPRFAEFRDSRLFDALQRRHLVQRLQLQLR